MSSIENKRFKPIVDDVAAPIPVDYYSEDEVNYIPLADLYRTTCTKLETKVNPVVLAQLPTTARHHYRLHILDCSGTYLGDVGAAALAPVVAACIRLTHLLLPRVGMKSSGSQTLIKVLGTHPGITDINFSQNDLGTTVGKQLLSLVIAHKRISTMNLHETLIIQPIKRKVEAQVEKNFTIKETFSIPLVPEHPEDEDVMQRQRREEEEAARKEREARMQQELAERIPTWAPAALSHLSETLFKYRNNMEDLLCLFAVDKVHDRLVTPKAFAKAMTVAGIPSFSHAKNASSGENKNNNKSTSNSEDVSQIHACEFADLFLGWRRDLDKIDYLQVINALRPHAYFKLDATAEGGKEAASAFPKNISCIVLDRIYDARETLLRNFEMIDIDDQKVISMHELQVGIDAITASWHSSDVAEIVAFYATNFGIKKQPQTPKEGCEDGVKKEEKESGSNTLDQSVDAIMINYQDFLQRIVMPSEMKTPPAKDWMAQRSELVKLIVE